MPAQSQTNGRAAAGSLQIAYTSSGSGEPALIFVHGIGADRTYFSPQLARFASRRHVLAVDLRGHGESSVPDEVTIDGFVEDVIAVAESVGLERAIICGHSMGGVVGLKVAIARPQLVRGIAMVDGTVLFPDQVRQAGLTGLVPALAGEHWFEALSGYFNSRILDPHDPDWLKQRVMADARRTRPEVVRTFFASLFSSDYAAELESCRCPLLYIHAKSPVDMARLRRLRPDAVIDQMVGSGHYPMLTLPDQVDAMLDHFMEMVDHQPA